MYYKSGIFSDPTCSKTVNHAVIVLGYVSGTQGKSDFWIIKNSWSKSWGMDGYAYIQMNKNMCGIAQWVMTYC
jgi:C1A family cysteine protease